MHKSDNSHAIATNPSPPIARRFAAFAESIKLLLEKLPPLHARVRPGENIDKLDGWRALQQKPRALVESGGRPLLVATLYGPTGAGKSTLFTLLTGIEVPRSIRRPTSHGCAIAASPEVIGARLYERLFPEYQIKPLDDPRVLEREHLPAANLYVAPSDSVGESGFLAVLADVPDFNAIDQTNWRKAEAMLARAEIVLFVTYPESYKDAVVIQHLRPACRLAGHLIFLFNKMPGAKGDFERLTRELWDDLLAYTSKPESGFQETRQDGRSLHEFLASSPVYSAPFDEKLTLERIAPLRKGDAPFSSALRGLDAGEVLLSNLIEVSASATSSVRALLAAAEEREKEIEKRIATARDYIADEARWIAATQFPIGRLLAGLADEARENRPWYLRPIGIAASVVIRVASVPVKQIRRLLERGAPEFGRQEEIERDRRIESVERLIDAWRSAFTNEQDGSLSAGRCREASNRLNAAPLPPVSIKWEDFVRERGRAWVREHKLRAVVFSSLWDILIVGGCAAIGIDLLAVGGVGTLTTLAAAGAGTTATGALARAMGSLFLKNVLDEADMRWKEERAEEMAAHLEQGLADPLFLADWKAALPAVGKEARAELAAACAKLESLRSRRAV